MSAKLLTTYLVRNMESEIQIEHWKKDERESFDASGCP